MGYIWLLIAKLAGITKVVAMKQGGRLCPGSYNSVRINSFRAVICLAVSVCIFLCASMRASTDYAWIWVLSGLSNALNMFSYVICAEKVPLVFVEAVSLVGAVVIPLFAAPYLYSGEHVGVLQWLGCAALFCAVVTFSLKTKKATKTQPVATGAAEPATDAEPATEVPTADAKKGDGKFDIRTVGYLLLCLFSTAGVCITQKLYVDRVGKPFVAYFNLMTFTIVFACFAAVLLLGRVAKKKAILPQDAQSNKKLTVCILVTAVTMYAVQYTSTLAAGLLPSAVFYPLSQGIGLAFSAVSDVVIFKQKITLFVVLGLLLTLAGIVLINL